MKTARQSSDLPYTAAALSNLAKSLMETGDRKDARLHLKEAAEIFDTCGNEAGLAWTHSLLGDVERGDGKLTAARERYELSAHRFLELGDALGLGRNCADIGELDLEQGLLSDARRQFCRALMLFENVGYRRGVSRVLEELARLAIKLSQWDAAVTLAGAGAATRQSIATQQKQSDREKLESVLQGARETLSPQEWEQAWRRGIELPISDAIAFAKSLDLTSPPSGH